MARPGSPNPGASGSNGLAGLSPKRRRPPKRRPSSTAWCGRERLGQDLGEAAFDRLGDRVAQRAVVVALDDRAEEALDDQARGGGLAQAAGAQVEDLLGVDLGDGRRMG